MRDLQLEVQNESPEALRSENEQQAWWSAWRQGWSKQTMTPVDRALCEYAEKLTRTPHSMGETDVQTLREHQLDDVQIHDAIQVTAYFNYINRIADAVHVDLEPDMEPYPESGQG